MQIKLVISIGMRKYKSLAIEIRFSCFPFVTACTTMSSSNLQFLESIQWFLIPFGICVFNIRTEPKIKLKTRPFHIVYVLIVVFGTIIGLCKLHFELKNKNNPSNGGLAVTILFVIALMMAGSLALLMLFSLANRKCQMSLLRRIDSFDRQLHEHITYRIDVPMLRNNFISYLFLFILFEVLMFIAVYFKYYDNTTLLMFFVFYFVSDISFTAHTMYVLMYGQYLVNRYGILMRQLNNIFATKCQSMRKRFAVLMVLYEQLFQLQLLVMECFGSILLFTIVFHSIAITVSVYVLITDISARPELIGYSVVNSLSWMIPYLVRIIQIASTYERVASQVCSIETDWR